VIWWAVKRAIKGAWEQFMNWLWAWVDPTVPPTPPPPPDPADDKHEGEGN